MESGSLLYEAINFRSKQQLKNGNNNETTSSGSNIVIDIYSQNSLVPYLNYNYNQNNTKNSDNQPQQQQQDQQQDQETLHASIVDSLIELAQLGVSINNYIQSKRCIANNNNNNNNNNNKFPWFSGGDGPVFGIYLHPIDNDDNNNNVTNNNSYYSIPCLRCCYNYYNVSVIDEWYLIGIVQDFFTVYASKNNNKNNILYGKFYDTDDDCNIFLLNGALTLPYWVDDYDCTYRCWMISSSSSTSVLSSQDNKKSSTLSPEIVLLEPQQLDTNSRINEDTSKNKTNVINTAATKCTLYDALRCLVITKSYISMPSLTEQIQQTITKFFTVVPNNTNPIGVVDNNTSNNNTNNSIVNPNDYITSDNNTRNNVQQKEEQEQQQENNKNEPHTHTQTTTTKILQRTAVLVPRSVALLFHYKPSFISIACREFYCNVLNDTELKLVVPSSSNSNSISNSTSTNSSQQKQNQQQGTTTTTTETVSLNGTCYDWVYTIINISTVQYAILRTIVSRKYWPTEETIPYTIYGKLLEVKRLRRRVTTNNLSHLQYSLQLGIRLIAGLDYYLNGNNTTIAKSISSKNKSSSSLSSSIQERRVCEYWTEIEIKLYQQYCAKQQQQQFSSTLNNDTNTNISSSIRKAWYDGPKYSTIDVDSIRTCPVFTHEVLNNDTPLSCSDQSSLEQIRYNLTNYVNQFNNNSTDNSNNMPLFDSTPSTLDVDTDDWMYIQTNINDTDLVNKYGITTAMNADTSSEKGQPSIHNNGSNESTSSVKNHKSNNNTNTADTMMDTNKKEDNSDPNTTTLNHLTQMMDGVDAFFQSKSPIVEGVTVVPPPTKNNKSNTKNNYNMTHDKSATTTSTSSSTKSTTTTSCHQESKNDIDMDPVELMNILYKTLQLQTPEEVSTYLQSLDTNATCVSTSSRKDIAPAMDGNNNNNDNTDDDMFFRREDYDAFDNNDDDDNDDDNDDNDDDSDDENVDDEGWMNASNNSNIQGMLNEMKQMDIELAKQGVSLSRPDNMNDDADDNDNDDAKRAKEQMHLLSNMFQSIQSTNGGTGPFNNILAEQGIVVPEHLDELIVDSDDEQE